MSLTPPGESAVFRESAFSANFQPVTLQTSPLPRLRKIAADAATKAQKGAMRRIATILCAALAGVTSARTATAGVMVHIDKSSQRMLVAVDGRPAYVWPVSTGAGGFGTPTGHFRPRRMARSWFSPRYYGSPMPYSIFFHKGYAIHGTNDISRLGGPPSHGCVRLHPGNAGELFALGLYFGIGNTSIVVTGGNPGWGGVPRRRIS